jgi:hypothetical protein
MRRASALVAVLLGAGLAGPASRAQACANFNLSFVSPLGVGPVVDQSVEIHWSDTQDGPQATLDLLASPDPVPTPTSHVFPDGPLPGTTLAAGLSAEGAGSFTWQTASVPAGTYLLYAAFHNATTNVLVLPFATVTVAHPGDRVAPAVLITSPRSMNNVTLSAPLGYDARALAGGSVDLFLSRATDGSDATPLASGLPLGVDQHYQWDCSSAPPGPYVFKAIVHDGDTSTFTTLSPGFVLVEHPLPSAPPHCAAGSGFAPWVISAVPFLALKRRRPGANTKA